MKNALAWILAGWVWGMVGSWDVCAENWPCWRGPRLDGRSAEKNIPVHWNEESNILWRVALPGSGHASPIVWEDRVFTVSAVAGEDARLLICLDRKDGEVEWAKEVVRSPLERKHRLNSHASSTPATDGELVYATFLDRDEMVVGAYDMDGHQKWLVRPGRFSSMHGFSSSPVLHEELVIVNGDHDGDSYLVALNRETGRTVWKTPRENRTRSYCVPIIRRLAGRTQMILSGDQCVASYDPATGERHWVIDGPTEQFVASVVYNERADLLFVTGGYPEHHILAVRPDGAGNVTDTHIEWRTTRGVSYVPSPIAHGEYFLVVSDAGIATCFEAATGEVMWQERLGQQHASLISADGLVYFLNDRGTMNVIRPGPRFERVAQNELNEECFASPAISQGSLFIRGFEHLYRIGLREASGERVGRD